MGDFQHCETILIWAQAFSKNAKMTNQRSGEGVSSSLEEKQNNGGARGKV